MLILGVASDTLRIITVLPSIMNKCKYIRKQINQIERFLKNIDDLNIQQILKYIGKKAKIQMTVKLLFLQLPSQYNLFVCNIPPVQVYRSMVHAHEQQVCLVGR